MTEALSKIPFTAENFTGSPSLLRQLNEDQIETVGQLPKELVILAKYENVRIRTVEKVFEQLKADRLFKYLKSGLNNYLAKLRPRIGLMLLKFI